MKSKSFHRAIGFFIFTLAQLMIFALPCYAQNSSNFTSDINKQANMFRLPVSGSNRYLEITALSKTEETAFIAFPGKDSSIVRGFKYLVSDGTLGFIGMIKSYSTGKAVVPNVAIMVAITPDYGDYDVVYRIFKDETIYEDGSFPLTGVNFYDALTKEKGPVFSTSYPKVAYDALLKWAAKHVMKYKE